MGTAHYHDTQIAGFLHCPVLVFIFFYPHQIVLPNLANTEDSNSSFEFYLSVSYKPNLFYVLFNWITQSLTHKQGFIFHDLQLFCYGNGNNMKWKVSKVAYEKYSITVLSIESIKRKLTSNCWVIFSAFQQQRVIIPNKHGNKLVGILHESGTQEIVILCHGLRANKVTFLFYKLWTRQFLL